MCLLSADKDTQTVLEPACRLECKILSTKDYTDLLWTTVAEFPGKCILTPLSVLEVNSNSSVLLLALCLLTNVLLTY